MSLTDFLISPQAPEPSAAVARPAAKSSRPDAGGFRLGVLDNGKGNADHLLKFLVGYVKEALPVASVTWLRKTSMSHPSQEEIYSKLVAEADLVVSAIAD